MAIVVPKNDDHGPPAYASNLKGETKKDESDLKMRCYTSSDTALLSNHVIARM